MKHQVKYRTKLLYFTSNKYNLKNIKCSQKYKQFVKCIILYVYITSSNYIESRSIRCNGQIILPCIFVHLFPSTFKKSPFFLYAYIKIRKYDMIAKEISVTLVTLVSPTKVQKKWMYEIKGNCMASNNENTK